MKAKVAEIFKSIQGEGIYQGIDQVFVRFFGCNLSCKFCDTRLNHYDELSIFSIVSEIFKYRDFHSVSLTGGEPLLWSDFLVNLTKILQRNKIKIYLETNGVLPDELQKIISYIDIIAMDFKLPSSTGESEFWIEHEKFLKIASKKDVFVKAVITEETEFIDIKKSIEIIKKVKQTIPFILQPKHPFDETLKEKLDFYYKFCYQNGIFVFIIPQLHKLIDVK